MAIAPELAAVFSETLGAFLGESLGYALAGAASSLAQQEVAVELGDSS